MSLALYRKYRPGRFDDVIGQDHVVEPLKRALTNDKVHHAYLFSGPRGCGKTSSARILARSLNCDTGPTPDPCGTCNSCTNLAPNGPGSLDVIEMDAATHGLVDDARDLREKAVYSPVASQYKIYIIDEAHQLSPGAANALLKLVEEPPPHLRFIFATTEPEKIIGTIRSRTHHYAFRLVPTRILQTHLASICTSEKIKAQPAALALIARASGGSVRDSLSILGQLLAGSGPEGLTYDDAAAQLGVTDSALIDKVIAALAQRDGAELFRLVDQVVAVGHDPRRFVTDLLERLRDLLIVSQIPDATVSGLIEGPPELGGELVAQSATFGLGELTRAADLVSRGLSELKGATAQRLQLELLMARLILPAADSGPQALVARVEQLERQLASGVPASTSTAADALATDAPAPATDSAGGVSPKSPVPKRSIAAHVKDGPPPRLSDVAPSVAPSVAPGVPVTATEPASFDQVRALWPAFLDEVKAGSRVAWMMVMAAVPLSVSDGVVVAAQADKGVVTRFSKSTSGVQLSDALSKITGTPVTLELVHDPGHAQRSATSGEASDSITNTNGGKSATRSQPTADPKRGPQTKTQIPTGNQSATDTDLDVSGSADADDVSGIELVQRELGAVKITEYDGV